MKDLEYFGLSASLDINIKNSPFSLSVNFSGGRFNSRTEEGLPMFAFNEGYSDDVKITSSGRVRNLGLGMRYTPKRAEQMIIYPFVEIGFGHSRYRQHWRSCGPRTCILANYDDEECPEFAPSHQLRGKAHRSGTFFGTSEIGFMLSYPWDEESNDPRFYFGLSVRYEYGGMVNYVNPKENANHFYYDSGLGDEFDRPLVTQNAANDKTIFNVARHQQLHIKMTLLRIIF
jgi:hypothetical protein